MVDQGNERDPREREPQVRDLEVQAQAREPQRGASKPHGREQDVQARKSKPRPRVRKRHEQMELLDASGTRKKDPRGGKRKGAGRPPKGERAGSPHKRRPAFKASTPLHIVLRAAKAIGKLRRRRIYQALRWATVVAAKRADFRIVHLSIQRTHLHLLVEAANKTALARGLQGFQISAAKLINAAVTVRGQARRRGQVFTDRYHAELITSARQARRALAYVLNNWRKHREDLGARERGWLVDPFSSGVSFTGWKELAHREVMWRVPETYAPMIVWLPRTWLLSEGWRRHGLIPCREIPSSPPSGAKTTATSTC